MVSKKSKRCTREEVLEDIDDLAKEIIDAAQEIAALQKDMVSNGFDAGKRLRVSILQDSAAPSLRILAAPIRWRGED